MSRGKRILITLAVVISSFGPAASAMAGTYNHSEVLLEE